MKPSSIATQGFMACRFRGFLPIVIDVETGGFNATSDALLEIAMVILDTDQSGCFYSKHSYQHHINPFPGAHLDPAALQFNGIDPHNPLRHAIDESQALNQLFSLIRQEIKHHQCSRAILVGHNAFFDHSFLKAAVERNQLKHNPFHPFSTFDTASLAGLVYGQTVLARACKAAKISFEPNEAHCALYDAEKTAELFCKMVNRIQHLGGWPLANHNH